MKTADDILKLGNPLLYQTCEEVTPHDLKYLPEWVNDMHSAILDIRKRFQFGRAIAAPQLGIMKRLVYMLIDKPFVFINPVIHFKSEELIELWDDCMSFPNLLVKVKRHRHISLNYLDENWQQQNWEMSDDLAELLQHEVDHLDGILCTMHAIDNQSFKWRTTH